jgi:hypothetical protein
MAANPDTIHLQACGRDDHILCPGAIMYRATLKAAQSPPGQFAPGRACSFKNIYSFILAQKTPVFIIKHHANYLASKHSSMQFYERLKSAA